MSDKHVEKNFLYLLVISFLCHLAAYLVAVNLPPEPSRPSQEATMVDLTELPDLTPPPRVPRQVQPEQEIKRHSEKPQRVTREIAPKGRGELERLAPMLPAAPPLVRRPSPAPFTPAAPAPVQPEPPAQPPVARGEGIMKPKSAPTPTLDRAKLFPSATKLARLEDNYREKYRREVEEGEARFLNTDDILFGSFLRRLETSIYGVWHYPQAALVRGIEGTTPVKITFNRAGEIVRVDLLESSGSKILDDEVLRTLKQLGPVGSFPKGYKGEYFRLIAFFHYGSGSGRLR